MSELVGFTGTKLGMSHYQKIGAFDLLKRFWSPGSEFHYGDCEGSDFQAAEFAHYIGYYMVSHPPINPRHRGWFEYNDRINPQFDYVVRDHHIVDDSRILIATPHTGYEIIRSGTWTTVRYARTLKRAIYVIKPDGTIEVEGK